MEGPGLFGDEPVDPDDEPAASLAPPPPPSRRPVARPDEAPEAPLALYRRYRPDSFAEVIGQDHVTVPLRRALESNRVNHAYLFSGPRGCGKTTSARILARCLNCEQGPTSQPCGQCQSCQDLARGGPGSIDVIEIDAASHGGVEDARDLRERAFFAPVASRYKIYIVDEAHMVTTAGFNALLKLVEEPPPHTKFIFATTEPEKVIGTIRSRTHHYPFRLVPPRVLGDYLAEICTQEGVRVDPVALPLVVRAGAGSVRDSLSVLDQLLGGAGENGVEYDQAAALLGFTPDSLLDEIVDAFAAGDSAGVFKAVDKVIEVGQDPRRFAEDLLRRLRDLVILAAVPDAADTGLLDVSADQAERFKTQVAGMGAGELTRAAEVIATGLTDMRGTTAPRLHLELMCARVLLPGADADERGLHARMDRLERRVGMMGSGEAQAPPANWDDVPGARPATATRRAPQAAPSAGSVQPVAPQAPAGSAEPVQAQPPAQPQPSRPTRPSESAAPPQAEPPVAPAEQVRPPQGQTPAQRPAQGRRPAGAPPRTGAGASAAAAPSTPVAQPGPSAAPAAARRPVGQLTAAELRRVWPGVLEEVKRRKRFTYMMLSQHAQVVDVADGALVLGFASSGARDNFGSGGSAEVLAEALLAVIGVELRINSVLSEDGTAAASAQQSRRAPEPPPQAPVRQHAPGPSSPPPPREPEPEFDEVSQDDVELDAANNAEELLTSAFNAEIISVEELN
ncbi:DNA polymerase III subunit gamma and tau [Tessaracoccus caeni]|uniref:DNA polymerase III subunit gamma and tau n=1 Tax=Tessaracoccus caeni TaxID=3031239 RepID=UPI0023DA1BED|nr:DNA polymerase III subunit gamma and tau [Tessaracoccus caeni]MDF1490055.1 DNA polymerase III subunit gamma and tau [Tessaracoccus caeni]